MPAEKGAAAAATWEIRLMNMLGGDGDGVGGSGGIVSRCSSSWVLSDWRES